MLEIIQTLQAANASLKPNQEATRLFELFYHVNPSATADDLTLSELLTWTGHNPETPVEQLDFSDFPAYFSSFQNSQVNEPGLGERLATLQTMLQNKLTNLQIYRIGPASVGELYCIGQDAEGNFAGLKQISTPQ